MNSSLHYIIEFSTLRIFLTPHFPHSTFSTLRILYTPHFLHSALSTLRIFYTPHFLHSELSTLRIFYTPHFLHSALRTPDIQLRQQHSPDSQTRTHSLFVFSRDRVQSSMFNRWGIESIQSCKIHVHDTFRPFSSHA